MNDLQNRLAELLKAGVGDPPARVTVQAVRDRMARRRGVAAAGAATAIALVAAVSAGLSGQLGNPGPAASPRRVGRARALSFGMACRPWSSASR